MTDKLKPYYEYKKTGIEWLGKVPIGWSVAKAKHIFVETSIKNYPEEPLLSATQNRGVIPRSLLDTRVVMPMTNLETFKLVEEGNFVISLRSFQGGLEYSKYRGIVSPAYTVLKMITNSNRLYFKYLLKSYYFIIELQRNVTGIRQGKNIDVNDFREILLPVPPIQEQDKIVKFLDVNLAIIQRFISRKRILISLLNEQKKAIINKAVKSGVDSNVEAKNSGSDWIGNLPSSWSKIKAKRIFKEISIKNFPDETLLSVTQTKGVFPRHLLDERVVMPTGNLESFKLVEPGNFVISLRSFQGGIEYSEYRGIVSPAYTVLKATREIFDKYFVYLLKSFDFISELQKSVTGIRQGKNIDAQDFGEVLLPMPPYNEQEKIVNYINTHIEQIDNAIAKTQQEISLISEYRTRLISDVVTGRVDVQNIELTKILFDNADISDEQDEEDLDTIDEEVDDIACN